MKIRFLRTISNIKCTPILSKSRQYSSHSKSGTMTGLHPDVSEIILTQDDIQKRVKEMGRQIATDYADRNPLIVGTLKGAIIFMSDLVRSIDPVPLGLELDFIQASSYGGGTSSSGKVAVDNSKSALNKAAGRHVLLVEDIVDSGNTATALSAAFNQAGAASFAMVSLLDKPSRREVDFQAKYVGFTIDDVFVIGYGLDYDQQYRSLPYVGILKPSVYEET